VAGVTWEEGDGLSLSDQRSKAADLYRAHGPAVYRRCLRILKEPEAARDATQEVFVKLIRDMTKLEDRETVLPWIYRVATNHCLNQRRNVSRRGEDLDAPPLELAASADHDALPDRQLVQGILSRFDVATQTVAVGVLVDGMEQEEVAAALGLSRRTVARKLARFLDLARHHVDRS
jgi:RNA polymerase sigma-70 factor (ECF subfamily)